MNNYLKLHRKSKRFKLNLTKRESKKNRKIYKCILIIFLSLIFIIININNNNINININIYDVEDDDDIKPDNATIYYEEKFDSYREAFNRAKDFINNNIKGILINTQKINLLKRPKVSAVIPCYNCKDFILKAVRSIQNQDLSNLEIIIVNDFSNDNTLLYLNQLTKEDERIKIVNNKKNMGTLYSRSIGALSANGKYIFPIDSDDMLLDKDVFSTITNISDKGNFDIVVFNSINTNLKPDVFSTNINLLYFEGGHKPNIVLQQPELGYYPFQVGEKNRGVVYMEVYIFAKCIKTKIYKKALNKLGIERYSRHMILEDDLVTNYIIFITANILKFVPKYGYIYIERKGSSTRGKSINSVQGLIYGWYVVDVIIEFSKNIPRNKEIIISFVFAYLKRQEMKDAINSNDYNKKLFISILDRMFNCKYISNEDKIEVRKIGKTLDYINYKF